MMTLTKSLLRAALRDRLVLVLGLLLAAAAGFAWLFGLAAALEQREMAAAVAGGTLRPLVVFGLVLYVVFRIRRGVEGGELEWTLTRPLPRHTYVLAHLSAVAGLGLGFVVIAALAVLVTADPPLIGLAWWTASLFLESILMAAVALFFALALPSAAGGVLATLGFYVLTRFLGVLLGIAAAEPTSLLSLAAGRAMQVVALALPRLDLFGPSVWLVHGPTGADAEAGLGLLAAQSLIYTVLVTAAAVIDLNRREF